MLVAFSCKGQVHTALTQRIYCTDEDRAVFDRYIRTMKAKETLPPGDLIVETARFFAGTPYVASTLEKTPEGLVINLREMDCTTFVENVIALACTVKDADPSFDSFCLRLQRLRYRNGMIDDYTGRLHYFSDWIFENERTGLVRDVTKAAGGKPCRLTVSFMTTHPDSYPALQSNPERIRIMHDREQEISAREDYSAIPKARINDCREGMNNGDIVCFVTNIRGLDISHLGIVCRQGETAGLIHASSQAKKVIAEPGSLQAYAERIQTTTGIMIVRAACK
jgi:hypothetical protein